MSTLASIIIRDVFSALPAAGINGRLFFATDKLQLLRDNGTTWDNIGGLPSGLATGDVFYINSSGVLTRLPVDSDGKVLTLAAGIPSWAAGGGGGGGGGSVFLGDLPSPPALSGWTWVNQGPAIAAQTQGKAILLTIPDAGSLNWRLLVQAISTTPWKVRAAFRSAIYNPAGPGSSQTSGIYMRNSSSGKIMAFEILTQGTSSWTLRVESLNSVTSDNATPKDIVIAADVQSWNCTNPLTGIVIWQLRNDGTSIYFDYSMDGENFFNFYSETLATFISSVDQIGIGGVSVTSNSANGILESLIGWKVDSNATL